MKGPFAYAPSRSSHEHILLTSTFLRTPAALLTQTTSAAASWSVTTRTLARPSRCRSASRTPLSSRAASSSPVPTQKGLKPADWPRGGGHVAVSIRALLLASCLPRGPLASAPCGHRSDWSLACLSPRVAKGTATTRTRPWCTSADEATRCSFARRTIITSRR